MIDHTDQHGRRARRLHARLFPGRRIEIEVAAHEVGDRVVMQRRRYVEGETRPRPVEEIAADGRHGILRGVHQRKPFKSSAGAMT